MSDTDNQATLTAKAEPFESEIEKLKAMVEPSSTIIAGIKLRPFSGGSLAFLQLSKSPFIFRREIPETELYYEILAVLYCQSGPVEEVARCVWKQDEFRTKVLLFGLGVSIKNTVEAGSKIMGLMEAATVGLDFQVDSEAASPNV